MIEELIQFPSIPELKEMLIDAREDIKTELQDDHDLIDTAKLLFHVIDIIEEKISTHKDFNDLNDKEKIDLAAHICFLNMLEDDFYLPDEDMDGLEFEETELDEEEHS
jgi:hypothetical protein